MVKQAKPILPDPAPRSRRRKRVSMDEFFAQTEGQFAEWVDGEVIYLTVTDPHQDRVQFLSMLMRFLAEENDLGRVRTAPYSMKIANLRAVREPDIMFVAGENLSRVTLNYVNGPPGI